MLRGAASPAASPISPASPDGIDDDGTPAAGSAGIPSERKDES